MNLKRIFCVKYSAVIVFVYLLIVSLADASTSEPNFQLSLTNRTYISSNEGYFDILIKHTNYPQTDFRYAGGQYYISLDTFFLSDHLHYIYTKDTATYGNDRIPPKYIGSLSKINDLLILDSGQSILQGSEPIISNTTGTIVARIRFFNPDLYSGSCLLEEQFVWKIHPPGDYTKIFASISGEKEQLNNNQNYFSTYDLCVGTLCCLSAPLPPPVRISPENNSLNISSPVTLIWQRGFPVSYFAYVQVAADSAFNVIVHEDTITAPDGTDNISYTFNDLRSPGTYYWRVRQGGIPPAGAFNEPWKFSIGSPPVTLNIKAVPEGILGTENYNPYEVKVYLRNSQSPYQLVDSSAVLASDSSFLNTFVFNNTPSGNYYIVYTTNNCIETCSRMGGEFLLSGNNANYYDFTASDSLAYGYNLIFAESLYCVYSGDVNQDGRIDVLDLLYIYNNSNEFINGSIPSDLTGDDVTDLKDLLITYNNSSKFISRQLPSGNNDCIKNQFSNLRY